MPRRIDKADARRLRTELADNASCYLKHAADYAISWLAPCLDDSHRPSEFHWIQIFGEPALINTDVMEEHKRTWGIAWVKGGSYAAVVDAVVAATTNRLNDPSVERLGQAVEDLALALGQATNPGSNKRHVSWASKILHHAWPRHRSFIFDQHSNRATGFWASAPGNLKPLKGGSDYVRHLFSSANYFDEVSTMPDFRPQLEKVRRAITDPADKKLLKDSGDFLERRLFDKFVFLQGRYIAWFESSLLLPRCPYTEMATGTKLR